MKGRFISFEGVDGCGKSTQLHRLAERLQRHGETVFTTREPGGTRLGEQLRGLVLAQTTGWRPAPETELALMCASRAQSVAERIVPALERGEWVLCDRFHDATEAYQGGGRGLERGAIQELHRLLCRDLQPDLTLVLELEPRIGLERARRRLLEDAGGEGRFEAEDPEFFKRVAAVYREIAAREPARCRRLDASGSPEAVAERVMAAVSGVWSGIWSTPGG